MSTLRVLYDSAEKNVGIEGDGSCGIFMDLSFGLNRNFILLQS
jgi:hypothetical protein